VAAPAVTVALFARSCQFVDSTGYWAPAVVAIVFAMIAAILLLPLLTVLPGEPVERPDRILAATLLAVGVLLSDFDSNEPRRTRCCTYLGSRRHEGQLSELDDHCCGHAAPRVHRTVINPAVEITRRADTD